VTRWRRAKSARRRRTRRSLTGPGASASMRVTAPSMKLPVKQKTQFSLIYLLIAVLVLSLVQSWLLAPRTVEIPMSKFLALVREDKVERLSITDREIRGILKPGALPAPQPSPGDKVRSLVGADQQV